MPRRWCSDQPCNELIRPPATRCDVHEVAAQQRAAQRRAKAAAGRPRRPYADAEYRRNAKVVVERARAAGEVCVKCGRPFGADEVITAEHVVALRDGGSHELSNLGPAHSGCNSAWNRRS